MGESTCHELMIMDLRDSTPRGEKREARSSNGEGVEDAGGKRKKKRRG